MFLNVFYYRIEAGNFFMSKYLNRYCYATNCIYCLLTDFCSSQRTSRGRNVTRIDWLNVPKLCWKKYYTYLWPSWRVEFSTRCRRLFHRSIRLDLPPSLRSVLLGLLARQWLKWKTRSKRFSLGAWTTHPDTRQIFALKIQRRRTSWIASHVTRKRDSILTLVLCMTSIGRHGILVGLDRERRYIGGFFHWQRERSPLWLSKTLACGQSCRWSPAWQAAHESHAQGMREGDLGSIVGIGRIAPPRRSTRGWWLFRNSCGSGVSPLRYFCSSPAI